MEFRTNNLPFGKTIRHVGRLAQIVNILARNGLWTFLESSGVQKWLTPEQVREAEEISKDQVIHSAPHEGEATDSLSGAAIGGAEAYIENAQETRLPRGLPVRLRKSLEELGPAFVKLGQMLAAREDLLPAPYIEELRKLHQNVVALPYDVIRKVLREELGSRLDEFEVISERPLAAGSIGQVHEARLRGGKRVVIKVQRPNIQNQIQVDLSLMDVLAGFLEKYLTDMRSIRPAVIVEEFSRGILSELDFIREGGNTLKTAANFANVPHVVVPEIYWGLTTSKVLTQSYIEGIAAWERQKIVAAGINPEKLVERGFETFLQMVFVDGLFHGDLHAGNLLALSGDAIGIIDFGLCMRLSRITREHLAGVLVALVREDYSSMVMHLAELSSITPDFDLEAFEHEVTNAIAPFVGLRLAELRTGKIFWDLAKISARHGAPLPRDLVLVFKTLVTFEGIGSHLSPGFDVIKSCEKFTQKIFTQMYAPEHLKQQTLTVARDVITLMRHAPFQVRRLLRLAGDGELSFNLKGEELGKFSTAIDRSAARLSVSIIAAALIIGSSILIYAQGKVLDSGHLPIIGAVGFSMALALGMYVIYSILRGGRL